MQKWEELSNLEKLVFDFSLPYPRKKEENQKCVHWILRLRNRDYGYLILKFSAQFMH